MNECWYAFALALLCHTYLTPERAFELLEPGRKPKRKAYQSKCITEADVSDMVKMKETMTYRQIGQVYGMKADTVYTRIRRYKGIVP